jgi:hypothetical protein
VPVACTTHRIISVASSPLEDWFTIALPGRIIFHITAQQIDILWF